jgi:hypothetical protein
VNEYQHAAKAILTAHDGGDDVATWRAVNEHRAALERIANGQAVVVDADELKFRLGDIYEQGLADGSLPNTEEWDAKQREDVITGNFAALAAQEGDADA